MTQRQPMLPTVSLKEKGFQYVPSYATDIRATFAKIREATRVPVQHFPRALPAVGRKAA